MFTSDFTSEASAIMHKQRVSHSVGVTERPIPHYVQNKHCAAHMHICMLHIVSMQGEYCGLELSLEASAVTGP